MTEDGTRNTKKTPVLGIIDAVTMAFIQNVPSAPNCKTVVADPVTNLIFMPLMVSANGPGVGVLRLRQADVISYYERDEHASAQLRVVPPACLRYGSWTHATMSRAQSREMPISRQGSRGSYRLAGGAQPLRPSDGRCRATA